MAKWWRETVTPEDRVIYTCMPWAKSASKQGARNPHHTSLIQHNAFFVRVAGFTFIFFSLDELRECLAFFKEKLIPPCRIPPYTPFYGDHGECQTWYQRLPRYLHDESKRPRVVSALERALKEFEQQEQS